MLTNPINFLPLFLNTDKTKRNISIPAIEVLDKVSIRFITTKIPISISSKFLRMKTNLQTVRQIPTSKNAAKVFLLEKKDFMLYSQLIEDSIKLGILLLFNTMFTKHAQRIKT